MLQKIAASIYISVTFLLCASAQSISYVNPDFFSVCETAEFQVQILNDTPLPLLNTELTVVLPAGIEYDSGDACEATNLNAPVFCIGNLQSNESQTVTFQARAICSAITTIDEGQLFCNSIIVEHADGMANLNADCYELNKPLLVITDLSEGFATGVKGQTIERTITILNTLEGPLSSFVFTDAHQEGMLVSMEQGALISYENNTYETRLGAADFAQIGDGDAFFEPEDGPLIITETIEVTSCGLDAPLSSISDISAYYDCFGAVCQEEETVAYLNYAPSTAAPDLEYTAFVGVPDCFCGNEGVQQIFRIVNNGNEAATDILVQLTQGQLHAAGIDAGSFAVENGGITTAITPESTDAGLVLNDCDLDIPVSNVADIVIPELAAGDSLFLMWDVYFCDFKECQTPSNTWQYKVSYFKCCPQPENLFVAMDEPELVSSTENDIELEILIEEQIPDNLFTDTELVTYTYNLSTALLNQTQGTFHLDIEVPCDFELDDLQDFSACGQVPDLATTATDTTVIYELSYDLPLNCDFSTFFDLQYLCSEVCAEMTCRDTIITSCPPSLLCTDDIPEVVNIEFVASFDTPNCSRECGIKICSEQGLGSECPPETYCEQIIPGFVDYEYDFYRLNAGQGDSNNDRQPDGPIDWNLANRYRGMTGDTLRSELRGKVIVDMPGASFDYGRIVLELGAENLFYPINGELFSKETGIVQTNTALRIYDQSADVYYECENPSLLPDPFFGFGYDISVNSLIGNGCGVPANFQYNQGDSIILISDYRIQYNLVPETPPLPPVVALKMKPSIFLFNEPEPAEEDLFSCGCASYALNITGYRLRIQEGSFGLQPCATADYGGGYLFRMELGDPDFFPFEYRPLANLLDWVITMPEDIELIESRINFLRYQNGNEILSNEVLTPSILDNTYSFSMSQYQNPSIDEGFIALFQHQFSNDCDLRGNFPFIVHAEVDLADNLLAEEDPTVLFSESNALRIRLPALIPDTLQTCDISYDNKNRWAFNFINESQPASENTALNTWIQPFSATGNVSNFVLTNVTDGTEYTSANGIFQLGDINPTEVLNLQIVANNTSCVPENVELNYGWSCEEYNDPETDACFTQTLNLKGIIPPGEVALTEETPPGVFPLCDTLPFFTLDYFNADLGPICNGRVQLSLPAGFVIAPGTVEISYPIGSDFVAAANPDLSLTGIAEWSVAELLPNLQDACLPGVATQPNNGFTLRFRALTTCDFPSGSRLRYFGFGEQNCGDETNTATRQSDKIFISGANAPYTASFNTPNSVLTLACTDTETLLVSFNTNQLTLPGDSVYVFLPAGLDYVSSSYQAINNASALEPITSSYGSGSVLRTGIPGGVSQVVFQFDISGFGDLDCMAEFIDFQVISHANALCLANNQTCSVPVITGELSVVLDFERPEFTLSDLQLSTSATGLVEYSVQVENTAASSTAPTIIDFYAEGLIVHADTIEQSLGTTLITGNFLLSNELLCDVSVLIDPNKHCACSTDELTSATLIDFDVMSVDTVCSGDVLEIGIEGNAGASYSWTAPTSYLDCPDCAETDFLFENNGTENVLLTYSLTENNGAACEINYNNFQIIVPPTPRILSADTEICLGDCANIITSPALNYVWTCAAVDNPGAQSQLVCPTETTTYCVEITDAFGCVANEEVTIVVKDLPVADAGPDLVFCPEDIAQLNAQTEPNYAYLWEPVNLVSNADAPNPFLVTEQETAFTLTVFADGCQASDLVNVSFGEVPDINVSTNIETICGNSFAQLTATGAENYEWQPSLGLSCSDCPTPTAMPEFTTTYYLIGTNAEGCFAIDSITINVSTEQIITNLDPEIICEGESFEFFGQTLTETGEYCEAFEQATGCDSLVCLSLTVLESLDTIRQEVVLCEGDSVEFEGEVYDVAGEYCFTFLTVNGCDSLRCLDLTIIEGLDAQISNDTSISLGESVQLEVTGNFQNYNWTPVETLSCTDCPNPIATPTETTTYTVLISDDNGCERSLSVLVTIVTDCELEELEMPNVFTPNGDETNDIFTVASESKLLEIVNLEVYSRWGQLLYTGSGSAGTGWDGNFEGKASPADVYVYLATVRCLGQTDEERELKGNVTLLR